MVFVPSLGKPSTEVRPSHHTKGIGTTLTMPLNVAFSSSIPIEPGHSERHGSADVGLMDVWNVKHLDEGLFVVVVFFLRVRTMRAREELGVCARQVAGRADVLAQNFVWTKGHGAHTIG